MNTARRTNTARRKNTARTMLIGSSALLVTALLTGCGVANGDLGALIPSSPAATITATPTPTAIPGDADGNGSLSEFEKQVLASHAPKDYTMPDGSVVQIDPTQPLSAEVVAVLKSKMMPDVREVQRAMDNTTVQAAPDLYALIRAEGPALGKNVVFVYQTLSDEPSGLTTVWAAQPASGPRSTDLRASADKDAYFAAIHVWADPRGYEIVILE